MTLRCKGNIGNCKVDIESAGRQTYIANNHITINDKHIPRLSKGLNFVLFDKVTGFILDIATFYTYGQPVMCRRTVDFTKYYKEFKQKYPGVKFISLALPPFPEDDLTLNEVETSKKLDESSFA